MTINRDAIAGLAICTAFHQRSWTPGTDIEQCLHDFDEIARLAHANLEWAGIDNLPIFDHDIAQAIWGLDRSEFDHIREAVE